jgi:hypothetical protein
MLGYKGVLRTITVGWRARARSVVVIIGTTVIVPGILMLEYPVMVLIPEKNVTDVA